MHWGQNYSVMKVITTIEFKRLWYLWSGYLQISGFWIGRQATYVYSDLKVRTHILDDIQQPIKILTWYTASVKNQKVPHVL